MLNITAKHVIGVLFQDFICACLQKLQFMVFLCAHFYMNILKALLLYFCMYFMLSWGCRDVSVCWIYIYHSRVFCIWTPSIGQTESWLLTSNGSIKSCCTNNPVWEINHLPKKESKSRLFHVEMFEFQLSETLTGAGSETLLRYAQSCRTPETHHTQTMT